MAEPIADPVAAERAACVVYVNKMSERWLKLAEAGGNETIDEAMARKLRRFFAGFADDIKAGMHVPDAPAEGESTL